RQEGRRGDAPGQIDAQVAVGSRCRQLVTAMVTVDQFADAARKRDRRIGVARRRERQLLVHDGRRSTQFPGVSGNGGLERANVKIENPAKLMRENLVASPALNV